MDEPKYKRVLLKISGEALAGDKHFGLDFQVMGRVCRRHQGVRGHGRPGGRGHRRRQLLARRQKRRAATSSAPAPTIWACWPPP